MSTWRQFDKRSVARLSRSGSAAVLACAWRQSMKVKILEVEGSPEELAGLPELAQVLRSYVRDSLDGARVALAADASHLHQFRGLSPDVQASLESRSPAGAIR